MSTAPFKSRGLILVLLVWAGWCLNPWLLVGEEQLRHVDPRADSFLKTVVTGGELDPTPRNWRKLPGETTRVSTLERTSQRTLDTDSTKGSSRSSSTAGNPTAPPIPPRQYWGIDDRIKAGGAADWRAGYQEGAMMAQHTVGHPAVTTPCPPALVIRQPEQIPTPGPMPILNNP